MRRLQHDRVVKLLGVILEDGNYSLVMEYVDRGNMMKVLHSVSSQFLHPLGLASCLKGTGCYWHIQRIESLNSYSFFCIKKPVAALPSLERADNDNGFPVHHRGANQLQIKKF